MDEQLIRLIKIRWVDWRHYYGLTQKKAAQICGVSRSTAQRWDDPAFPYLPDIGQFKALCAWARVDVREALRDLYREVSGPW